MADIIERLVVEEKVETFLFGSRSRFNDLCHELTTMVMKEYPHLKRIYVRAEYPNISDRYKAYLLEDYEETYYPKKILGAGRTIYVERNYEMIKKSQFCIVYYDAAYVPVKVNQSIRGRFYD